MKLVYRTGTSAHLADELRRLRSIYTAAAAVVYLRTNPATGIHSICLEVS
ncbi:hypothetical protein GCM10017673_58400 [Streptosporangium violaceochromogenes]|nr:hypothetical protein GCM10017673_58400 [Streptosporangium violaceochromogenes]